MYENRRSACVPCSVKPVEPKAEPRVEEVKVSSPCCKSFKVTSIIRINDEVLIALDDCTFIKAPFDVVDQSVLNSVSTEIETKVTALQREVEALAAGSEALAQSVTDLGTQMNTKASTNSVDSVKEKVDTLVAGIQEVQDLSGQVSFKAFNKTFTI